MIRAEFPNPKYEIFPGLFVRVRIPLSQTPQEAILVPERSVLADQAGRHVMVVADDDVVERKNIEMGAKYEDMVVVLSGLNGDERVVVNGVQRARPGAKVSPQETQLSTVTGTLSVVEEGGHAPPTAPAGTPAEDPSTDADQTNDAPATSDDDASSDDDAPTTTEQPATADPATTATPAESSD